MKLSSDEFEETVDVARDYLQVGYSRADAESRARDFAEALVQIAGSCVVGLPCEKHSGVVHGQEAEELRAGVEQILRNTADVDVDEESVLGGIRKALIFLLDHVDARDSLAFQEAIDTAIHAVVGKVLRDTDRLAPSTAAYRELRMALRAVLESKEEAPPCV